MSDPFISDRWMAFNDIPTDGIWWRYDIMTGKVMGSGIVFPARGAWHLSDETIAMIEEKFADQLKELRRNIRVLSPPDKLTLCGPLREHQSSDHDISTIGVSRLAGSVTVGPPVGWL